MEFKFSCVTLSEQLKPSVPVLIPMKYRNNGIHHPAPWEENQFFIKCLEGSLVLPECTGERMSVSRAQALLPRHQHPLRTAIMTLPPAVFATAPQEPLPQRISEILS